MDGMLSQDEINALLQGMDLSDTADGGDAAADPTPENSTAENYNNENEAAENAAPVVSDGEELTDVERMRLARWPISVWDPPPQPYIHW